MRWCGAHCVCVCVDMLSGEADVRAGVAALCVRCVRTRWRRENMRIRVPYVNTVDNLADFFTKPLPARTHFCALARRYHELRHVHVCVPGRCV